MVISYSYDSIRQSKKSDINDDKFIVLRNFLSIKKTISESNEPIPLPLYLQQRYKTTFFSKVVKTKEVRKLYTDTGHIVETVKSILTPLCESNKKQLFEKFCAIEFDETQYDEIIECIYTHSVYLQYAIDLYIELINILNTKTPQFTEKLINYIITNTITPIIFPDEEKTHHCVKSNAELVGKLIKCKCIEIDTAKHLINHLIYEKNNYILCLILKFSDNRDFIKGYEEYLSELILTPSVLPKIRFLAINVSELIDDEEIDD